MSRVGGDHLAPALPRVSGDGPTDPGRPLGEGRTTGEEREPGPEQRQDGSNVIVERARPEDAAALHEIARRTFVDATPPDAAPEAIAEFVAVQLSTAAFAGHIDSPASRVLVARPAADAAQWPERGAASVLESAAAAVPGPVVEAEGPGPWPAIGYALVLLDRSGPPEDADMDPQHVRGRGLFLSKFYLLPEARGTGASTAMMQAVFRVASEIGADYVWLTVNQLNPRANAFYDRMGLPIVGTTRFRLGARLHDDYVRARRVPSPR